VISGAVFGSFLGIGWTFWSTVTIPVDLITVDAADSTIALSQLNQTTTQAHFQFSSSIICFVVAFFCIIGYPILACCGACGLTVLPLSLILDFVNRPKFRRTADAKKVS
jgi:LMBR1 domain-containing protein 1